MQIKIALFLLSHSVYSFISFSYLTALARSSSMMLNRSHEELSCLVPSLSGKACNFSPSNIMLAIGFLRMFFIKLMKLQGLSYSFSPTYCIKMEPESLTVMSRFPLLTCGGYVE